MSNPIVFLPGLNCTGRLFRHQIARLSAGRTVVLANHRRHDTLAAIAAAVLDETPPRFVLAGLSMGGYIAFEILRQAPGRVSALLLMDTSARPDDEAAADRRRRLIAIAEAGRFTEVAALQFPALVAPERHSDPDLRAVVDEMAAATGPEAFIRQQRAIMARPDSRPGLSQIACPTLVLVGDRDQITPPPLAREIADAIPGARLEAIADCGHLASLERPEIVTAHLEAHLAGLDR